MKILLSTIILAFLASAVFAQVKDARYFELRIYYAAPGKLDALIKRFNDNTTRIFEKHGMTNVGYWLPVQNDQNALYYILAYPDKDARKKSWDNFGADPEWQKVKGDSEVNGKLVNSVTSVFMYGSDILPAINDKSAGAERTFELRTYHCEAGKRPNLIKRFQDHTVKLFEKHGMQNIAYFVNEQVESDLVYLIAHKNADEAKKSWAAFIADPDWIKVRDESEKDGKIILGRESIESVYMKPLPFSRIK